MHTTSYRRCVKTKDFWAPHILRAVSVLQWAPKKNDDFDNFAYTPHLEGKKNLRSPDLQNSTLAAANAEGHMML